MPRLPIHMIIAGMMKTFSSRRSPVLGTGGSVACTQPLASQIGIDILKRGGNAADASVAMATALSVTEPFSTGLGGDSFYLFYDSKSKSVKGINGSGQAPAALSLEVFNRAGFRDGSPAPESHPLNITVPGTVACWVDTLEQFGSGKLTLSDLLAPAIKLAAEGFPVAPVTALQWELTADRLIREGNPHNADMLIDGKAPKAGQIMKMPYLANALREISCKGKSGFYEGPVAEAIVEAVQAGGGVMTLDDLREHTSTYVDPICTSFRSVNIWECPPNGQGITVLMALNILEECDLSGLSPTSPEYIHIVTEALKLSFADSLQYCADPSKVHVPVNELLSKEYAQRRHQQIDLKRASTAVSHGTPSPGGDTVYFCVVDGEGNACSVTESIFESFGTGLVPKNCGFCLQNRGSLFKLRADHANCPAGQKRSYHTIIPSMMTRADDGELLAAYGVMGGFMQPQGHVQVVMNMVHFGMDPQTALDHPRFHIAINLDGVGSKLSLEEGIPEETLSTLSGLGHDVHGNLSGVERRLFGRGQVITMGDWWQETGRLKSTNERVLWAGSDPRADGIAIAL